MKIKTIIVLLFISQIFSYEFHFLDNQETINLNSTDIILATDSKSGIGVKCFWFDSDTWNVYDLYDLKLPVKIKEYVLYF